MLNKLRKNNKKGFTLVELIVVLVILAILAALLIPALTGYINKAKERQIIGETRQAVMAAQTLADEEYAKTGGDITVDATFIANVKLLAEVSGTIDTGDVSVSGGLITKLVYSNNGKTCTYTKASASAQATFNVTDTP